MIAKQRGVPNDDAVLEETTIALSAVLTNVVEGHDNEWRALGIAHVELYNPNPPPNCVGYIHTNMSPMNVARNASEDARSMCYREYGSAPDVRIYGDPDFTFP
ncbi:hypothetical protein JHK86_039807 [Glycine max]|nr:hypothetical protein JHK86_039807 [Glycine max]